MKKLLTIVLSLFFILGLTACSSGNSYVIEIIIPAGSTEAFVFSDEEISPHKSTLTVSAGAGIAETEVILKPVEVREENVYTSAVLKQGEPVKLKAEKGAWYKIGVAIQNPAEVPIAVAVRVGNADVRIAYTNS